MLQNFILNTVSSDWLNDKELTNGSLWYKLRGKRLREGPKYFDITGLLPLMLCTAEMTYEYELYSILLV